MEPDYQLAEANVTHGIVNPMTKAASPGGVVTGQLSYLAEAIGEAEKLAAMVEERLGAILVHEPQTDADEPSYGDPATGVPLGDTLAALGNRMRALNSRLGGIHGRIEL